MNKVFLIVAVSSLLLHSCGNATKDKSYSQTGTSSHNQASEALKLNSGERWVVNEEMKPFVLEAERVIQEYKVNQSQDYQTLATQLKEKNNGLIKSCTMKGESHQELHKWLYLHNELIESLSKAESTKQASKIITDLQASFSTYNQYFQ